MNLVVLALKDGTKFTASPENIRVFPGGDVEYRKATHEDFRQRVYTHKARGVVRPSEVSNVNYY